MRIGELAALVGVTTRTVRHYHHLGLLPEPARRANGYREYRLRDAVVLARIRRLAELGLSLDEIRDVLADDQGRELREVLAELDADLARQQEAIAARRARLAALLREEELDPDAPISPDMAEVLRHLPAEGSRLAAVDRGLLTLLDTVTEPAARERVLTLLRPLTTPEAVARGRELYRRLEELADADPGDPRVAELAADFAASIPAELTGFAGTAEPADGPGGDVGNDAAVWLDAITAELSPAQAEVVRLTVRRLAERREEGR
ncbi:MerR family transcriptional regulator [Thermopolyspora flexuosa]|jgi:DNA-binding transcriptional MerR regulator|uniref:DNA-binding transcriptional MerR regulator n=1 Tax=Thermopolyspora flexuosa TaxID=103836 RepID=A0A543IS54_9ACTN|nr:MerR family transcriptional regulator [Thermopolyspora flexuosa]TQM73409.1 DNA-binding transcriptional MerR regulator [Thermopolyspora flexuosa]GGM80857.1 MerR family transcriptional regulator [Thermopolyspora flexuosa]